ncbi:uncharacterized protein N7446_000217 [Penicillium canescens]|uniref:Uncharacterized protein n=1 Tax=Penicillium canescens TaxID=5083 RepID=A0AAD6I664_PENCN|nr:uncharacterized protein N7446_000217 [Penicillium canescens]KAJ6030719.1 hypothetical protein N7460_010985 [Penicillium canescens]KAJ6059567.1 hypothetical protein N7444_003206 [Penicillium canescens]KAJ6077281.1 hypothetical protein N7446_000217 [Penicillium canescens]
MAPISFDILNIPLYAFVAGSVAFIFLFLKALRELQSWKYSRDNGCQPPLHSVSHGPFGISMILSMVKAGREHRFTELIRGWHRAYGTTFRANMGGRKAIFTAEPKNIQAVLAHKFKDFELGSIRNEAARPLLGSNVFTTDGSEWEHSRAMLRPNFSRTRVSDTDIYESHVAKLIKHIPRDGSTVDLQDLFLRMTIDTATEFLFGESTNSLEDLSSSSPGSIFAREWDLAQEGTATRLRIGPLMNFYLNRRFWKAIKSSRDYAGRLVQKAIDYRIAVNNGQEVPKEVQQLMDKQYVFSYELSKETLDKKQLTDQLLSILLAGRDTTANTLSITFFHMAKQPEIWNKIRQEVLALEGRRPSFNDLKSMTYMSWVLNETLRLYPIVPFNLRMANKDTHLPVGGGPDGKSPVHVPKGYEVIYNVYTMHRSAELYGPDADEYRPERWEKLRPGWAYLPFNGGPRICLGQQFALTEAGYTIVRIMQEFEAMESRDPNPFVQDLKLTMSSANGAMVGFTPVPVS